MQLANTPLLEEEHPHHRGHHLHFAQLPIVFIG